MVLYNRETLMFYAIVDNSSPEICWPFNKALDLLKQYHLDVVQVESLGSYQTFGALCDGLCTAFRDVAKGKIVEEEEGSVIYLTMRHKSGKLEDDQVLSLCKLKTIEYRIFRKMREKLRSYYHKDSSKTTDNSKLVITKF